MTSQYLLKVSRECYSFKSNR